MNNDETKTGWLDWKSALKGIVNELKHTNGRLDEIQLEQKVHTEKLADIDKRLAILEITADPNKVAEKFETIEKTVTDLKTTVDSYKLVVKIVSTASAALIVHALVTTFGG